MMRAPFAAALLAAALAGPAFAGPDAPADALRAYVLAHRPWSDVEIRNVSYSAGPPPGIPARIVVAKGLPGRTVFAMTYPDGASVTATADVAAFEEIVVSARALSKDRPLGEDDVCLSRIEVGRVPPGALRDPQQVVGKVLSRSVGANLPIVERYVGGSGLVKRGRKVILLIESGGLRIAAAGETRENGYVSSPVKAVNIASGKTVAGILVDENTVRVAY